MACALRGRRQVGTKDLAHAPFEAARHAVPAEAGAEVLAIVSWDWANLCGA
jgi:hypothetical protein